MPWSARTHAFRFARFFISGSLCMRTHVILRLGTTTTTRPRQVGDPCFFMRVVHFMAESSWQPVMSAAQLRRQRRLRSWWRHEQQSIAAALATFQHHSALRGQKMARAGEEESELRYTAKVRKTPLPSRCSSACTKKSPAGCGLPAWQSRRGRRSGSSGAPWSRTCSHGADPRCSVPQVVNQLVEVLRTFDTLVLEQVIVVPKITSRNATHSAQRSACRRWQNSWWKCPVPSF